MAVIAAAFHGGAGGLTSSRAQEECDRIIQEVMEALRSGGDAFSAAVAGTRLAEAATIFNAGLGIIPKIGPSAEFRYESDAAVSSSEGPHLDRVVASVDAEHPILVAAALRIFDVRILVGQGATEFARASGLGPYPVGIRSEMAQRRLEAMLQTLREALREGRISQVLPWVRDLAALERLLGQQNGEEGPAGGCDTVGVLTLDANGILVTAASTGGFSFMPPGRGGDVLLRGAGFENGQGIAVLATGRGEAIIDRSLAGRVHNLVLLGVDPSVACEQVVTEFFTRPDDTPAGVIVLTSDGRVGHFANRLMPFCSQVEQLA